ncbi:hypothetical protein C8Q77DRAFT_206355 [Trametes polyzona]|nr:hypothetical protein C8Q77DRAFT_206355 [Trametes polyzona]
MVARTHGRTGNAPRSPGARRLGSIRSRRARSRFAAAADGVVGTRDWGLGRARPCTSVRGLNGSSGNPDRRAPPRLCACPSSSWLPLMDRRVSSFERLGREEFQDPSAAKVRYGAMAKCARSSSSSMQAVGYRRGCAVEAIALDVVPAEVVCNAAGWIMEKREAGEKGVLGMRLTLVGGGRGQRPAPPGLAGLTTFVCTRTAQYALEGAGWVRVRIYVYVRPTHRAPGTPLCM